MLHRDPLHSCSLSMSVVDTPSRAGRPEFANLLAYIEPKVQTKERKIVLRLIDIHGDALDSIDTNVATCMYVPSFLQVVS